MDKGTNIYKKSANRILEIDPTSKQVNFLDSRFYKRNGEYYPSVTYVLSYFPKNKFFETWLKDVGHNADVIVRKAAEDGTQVHSLVESYLLGEEQTWLDERGNAKYSLDVWKMLLKFVNFWETHKPTLIETEVHLFSDEHKIAGTCDLVVELAGERWILDVKTSNSLHTSYDLQTSAYATCWNESYEEKVDRAGILWLKSSKRGPDKSGKKIQGKGWELFESSRDIETNFGYFKKIHDIFKLENDLEPVFESLPITVQRVDVTNDIS